MKGWIVAVVAMGVPWLGAMLWFHWEASAPDGPQAPPVPSSPDSLPAGADAPVKAPATGGDTGQAVLLSAPIRLTERLTDWIHDAEPIEIDGYRGKHAAGFADLARRRHPQALTYFDRILAHDGNDLTAMLGKAMALAQEKKWDDASLAYERLLERCPGAAEIWSQYGDVCAQANDAAAAVAAYERALSLDGRNARTRFNLAVHEQALGQARKALAQWRTLTDSQVMKPSEDGRPVDSSGQTVSPEGCPEDVSALIPNGSDSHLTFAMLTDAWHHRGEVAMELHLADEAVNAFRQVTARDEGSVSGWCNLGIALSAAARYDEAKRALAQALALDANCLPAVNQMVFLHARRFHVLRDSASYATLMHWCERSLAIHPKQDNILELRAAAGRIERDDPPPSHERSADGT